MTQKVSRAQAILTNTAPKGPFKVISGIQNIDLLEY